MFGIKEEIERRMMTDSSQEIVAQMSAMATAYGLNVLGALVILIVGFVVAGRVAAFMQRALGKMNNIDVTLSRFLSSLVRYVIIAVTVIAVLGRFGVETASLIAVVGAAGLAIGLALQGTLSNIAAGVMLLIFRPFKIGDFVEISGEAGTVQGITLFVTEMSTGDNVHIIIPNAQIWGAAVKNYSFHATRRIDLAIGVGYDDDLNKARETIVETIISDQRSLKDPAPLVAVSELGDSSVNFVVRIWCASGDYWPLRFDLLKAVKERLDQEGLSIPYPQHDIHLIKSA